MKLHHLPLALAMAGLLIVSHARAGDAVADEAKLATVEKSTSRQEARAAQKASITRARATGELGNEWTRNQNTPSRVAGTHESRKPAHQVSRDLVKQQAKAGQVPGANDEWVSNQNTPAKVEGTRPERRAERKEIRADLKAANRRGEIPMVTEAGLGVGR